MTNEIVKDIFVRNRGLPVIIDYIQKTNAISIVLNFRDYIIPSGAEARIYVKKPSGKEVYNSASISGNTVTVSPTTQMFAEAGEQEGQIQITSGQKILVSFLIIFRVERNIISDSAVESANEYAVLDQLIIDARSAVSAANTATGKANSAATAANNAAAVANSAAAAAKEANTAAGKANSAATAANNAAAAANQSGTAADAAAKRANAAAARIDGILDGTSFTELENKVNAIIQKLAGTITTE